MNLGEAMSSLNVSYRETKKPIIEILEGQYHPDRSRGVISLDSERNFIKMQKLPQQIFKNNIDKIINDSNMISPVNLTTYMQ
jgi:hypothetical protein